MAKAKITTIATVLDSGSPRYIIIGAAAATSVLSVVLAMSGWPAAGTLFLGSLAALFAYDVRPRQKARARVIECNVGSVRIRGVGKIRARDLVGATTARHEGRVSLMLAHKKRKNPIFLDLPNDDALAHVSKSLGLGHHGFGVVGVGVRRVPAAIQSYISNVVALGLITAWMLVDSYAMVELLRPLTMLALMLCAITFIIRAFSVAPKLTLTSGGVFLTDGTFIPFNSIERVDNRGGTLDLGVRLQKVEPSRMRGCVNAEELAHVVSQVRAASERAHGNFVIKHEPPALEQLRRAPGEKLRDWLGRIDTLGVGTVGYRTAEIDPAELWTILEDPEADVDLRTASARLLARVAPKEAQVRVDNVLETVRDAHVRVRIEASVDDAALEEQEREEALAKAKPA